MSQSPEIDHMCRVCHKVPATTRIVYVVDHAGAQVEHHTCDRHADGLRADMLDAGWRIEQPRGTVDGVTETLLASQLRRIDRLWARYEQTGDKQWLTAATEADRYYLRMRERADS